MPQMEDPRFSQALTYICEHNEQGAMGIVINQPMQLTLGDVLSHLNIADFDTDFDDEPVLCGGPVETERGFILHQSPNSWDTNAEIADGVYVGTSQDILEAIAENRGPLQHIVALGYAGWGPMQLEEELSENVWLNVAATPDIIFHTPIEQRWQAAASLLGVDLSLLSSQKGHS